MDCIDCSEPITSARIKALPKTVTCLDCQIIRERDGKFNRHVMNQKDVIGVGGEIEETEMTIVRAK